jgi:hypothetical protein
MMNPQTIPVGELIYEAEIRFTNIVEYGVSMAALSSGKIAVPGLIMDSKGMSRGPKGAERLRGLTTFMFELMVNFNFTSMLKSERMTVTIFHSLQMGFPFKLMALMRHN